MRMPALLHLVQSLSRVVSNLVPDQTIAASKEKWNRLGAENPRFYVVSKKGTAIDDKAFADTGEDNYRALVSNDELLKSHLGSFKDKRVLDIGSGLGRLTKLFSADFKEAVGVDISDTMVEQAKARAEGIANVRFVATNGVSFPFPDASFDLVFSYIVFQHMPSREVVLKNLKEARRVLAPTGIAKIQIRGGHQPYKWQWFYGPAFTKEQGVALANEAGFRVLKTSDEDTKRFWLWLA